MKTLENLTPSKGSTKKRKRVGRGIGSGWGKTAAKGHKGQKARSGRGVAAGFEVGQTPLYRRLPKYGFSNNQFAQKFTCVKVEQLNTFADGDVVTVESLMKAGLVSSLKRQVKIIGKADLNKKLTVQVNKVTSGAKESITKNGGTVKEV